MCGYDSASVCVRVRVEMNQLSGPLCLGVAAPQMFWLFLVPLCFWFLLVCLELKGLEAIHDGTFNDVLVKSLRRAPSEKRPVPVNRLT